MAAGAVLAAGVLFGIKGFLFGRTGNAREISWRELPHQRSFWIFGGAGLLVFAGCFQLSGGSLGAVRFTDLLMTYFLLAWIDFRWKEIPDPMLALLAAGQLLLCAAGEPAEMLIGRALLGAAAYLLLLIIFLISRGNLGMGDVKLLALTAAATSGGYLLQLLFWSLLCAFAYSIVLLANKKGTRKTELPFVPFLTCGMLLHAVAGII